MPTLQAFYGWPGVPWLEMPHVLLAAYIRMLPRLRAERALEAYEAVAMGTPPGPAAQSASEARQRRTAYQKVEAAVAQLEALARGGVVAAPARPRPPAPAPAARSAAELSEVGFALIEEPAPADAAWDGFIIRWPDGQ